MPASFDAWYRHRWTALALAATGLVLVLTVADILPRWGETLRLYRTWRARQATLYRPATEPGALDALALEHRRLQTRLDALMVRLPAHNRTSVLLHALHTAAGRTGTRLIEVTPHDEQMSDTYAEVPFRLQLQGRFYQIGAFVQDVEHTSVPLQVRSVELHAPETAAPFLEATLDVTALTANASPTRSELP